MDDNTSVLGFVTFYGSYLLVMMEFGISSNF